MPILVPCPKCGTNLSAPDDAAGKRVRCPQAGCGAIAEVPGYLPAEEVAVVDATVVRPRRRRVEAVEVDEELDRPAAQRRRFDDDDDYRPRPKRRRAAGPSAGAIIAIAISCLLVVGGTGVGVYLIVNKKNNGSSSKETGGNHPTGGDSHAGRPRAPIPAGWIPQTSPSNSFRAYFPEHAALTNSQTNGNSVDMAILGGPRKRLAIIVLALKLPPQAARIDQDQLAELMRQGVLKKQGRMRLVSQRSLTWLGRKALEMTFEQSNNKGGTLLMRQVITDRHMFFAFFGDATGRPKPEESNGFFDNFEIFE